MIGWGVAVAEVAKLFNKVMEWFSPGQIEKKNKATLDRLEKDKAEILSQPPSASRARKLAKIIQQIDDLRSKLHT
jgi:hypothetical protein